MIPGLLFAAAAALAYGTASALQSLGVRRARLAGGSNAADFGRQPLYLIGLGLDGAGFVGAAAALQSLPLFLVQSVIAANVVVTAAIAAATGTRLGRGTVAALTVSVVGLVLLGQCADAEAARPLGTGWRWFLLGCAAVVAAAGGLAGRTSRGSTWVTAAVAAGLSFSLVAVAARVLVLPHPIWRVLTDPALWALAVAGISGASFFAVAVGRGAVTAVAAVTFTAETVVPAVVGLVFLGDQVRPGWWPVALAGFVLAVGGAIALGRFAEGVDQPDTH